MENKAQKSPRGANDNISYSSVDIAMRRRWKEMDSYFTSMDIFDEDANKQVAFPFPFPLPFFAGSLLISHLIVMAQGVEEGREEGI